ncbi:DUF3108 domain-containing protein [Alphaproteobacteria bacterium]|nr:DUF3108 domain-containing protein [Alphaproteobacteria bacterium]
MQHQQINYTIDYLSSENKKRGQEPCIVTIHSNGDRTIRARSEIYDSEILRDVIYTVDHKFKPIDCYIRVREKEKIIGTSWFNFYDNESICEGHTTNEGRISQIIKTKSKPDSFISHAVATDVWHCANIKKDSSLGVQIIKPVPSCSPLPNGASGPMLETWIMRAKYVGIENIETPAGLFEAEHVRYLEEDGSLWLEMWCTNDSNRIMLKMIYPVYNSTYILSKLEI